MAATASATTTTSSDTQQPPESGTLLDPNEWIFDGNVIMLTQAASWEIYKTDDNGDDSKDDEITKSYDKDNKGDNETSKGDDPDAEREIGSTIMRVEAVRRYLGETQATATPSAIVNALAKKVWNDGARTALGKLLEFVENRLRFGGKVVQVLGMSSKHTRLFFGDYTATHSHHCGRPVYEKVESPYIRCKPVLQHACIVLSQIHHPGGCECVSVLSQRPKLGPGSVGCWTFC